MKQESESTYKTIQTTTEVLARIHQENAQ